MKRILLSIILFLISVNLYAQYEEKQSFPYPIKEFRGGLNTRDTPLKLKDNETQDSKDCVFDENMTLSSRYGYSEFATLPVSGTIYLVSEYKRQSGESWLMVHIATSVYASQDSGTTWVKVVEGLSEVYGGNDVVYNDEWYFTNGVDDVFSWNASTVSFYGFIPQGKCIEVHNEQLFVGNVPENYSAIFWCNSVKQVKTIGGWDYFNSYIIGANDGDVITGLKSEGSILTITKTNSFWYMEGNGANYNVPIRYTDVYGSVSQKSYRKSKETPLFLSKEGFCAFNDGNIIQVDRKIDNITRNATVSVGTIIGKNWIQTTENDFRLGYSSAVDVTDGIIRLYDDAVQYGDNSKNEFEGKTIYSPKGKQDYQLEYISSDGGTEGEVITLPETAVITLPYPEFTYNYTLNNISINLKRTSSDIFKSSVTVEVYSSSGALLGSHLRYITDLGNGDWYTFFTTFSVTVNQSFTVKVKRRNSNGPEHGGFDYYTYNYGFADPTYVVHEDGEETVLWADRAQRRAELEAEGWRVWAEIYRRVVYGDYYLKEWYEYAVLKYGRILPKWERKLYIRYQFSLNAPNNGEYISQKFDAGGSINTWKHFVAADNGTVTYRVKYATGTTALDNASWHLINNGGLIGATTSQRWIQWRANFTDKFARVESVLLRWLEVNGADYQDVSSEFHEGRYHTTMSTYGYTNNIIVVNDYNKSFSLWGVSAECLGKYQNSLLFGKSNKLYKLYDTRNDNGSAIGAYWISKDLDFGMSERDKYLDRISITAKGSGTLVVSYKSNYDTNYSTFGITLGGTMKNETNNTKDDSPGQYWTIKVQNNDVGGWFEIPEIRLYYRPASIRVR